MRATSKQTVDLGFGKVTLKQKGATISAFRVRAPFQRELATNFGEKVPNTYRMVNATVNVHNGALYGAQYNYPNGEVLMFQSSWRHGAVPFRDAVVFLRLRDTGPQYKLEAKVPQETISVCSPLHTIFQGRGDFMTLDELEAMNIVVPQQFKNRFLSDPEEMDECFEVSLLGEERVARAELQRVETISGARTVELAGKPQRRLFRGR